MAAFRSHGTAISVGGTTINKVKSIVFSGVTAETVDITTMDSTGGVRECLQSLIDPGTVNVTVQWDPADASHIALTTAIAGDPQAASAIVITLSNSGTDTIQGNAFVTSWAPSLDNENAAEMTFELKFTGALTYPS